MGHHTDNANAESAVGANRKILTPYLDYDIEIEAINSGTFHSKGKRGIFFDLASETVLRRERYVREDFVCVRWPDSSGRDWLPVNDVLPVLRPFSALCTPLPDGTVPSVEIAKLITLDPLYHKASYLSDVISSGLPLEFSIEVYLPNVDEVSILPYEDWLIWSGEEIVPYAVYDYLYWQHFAIGLQRHQFIDLV